LGNVVSTLNSSPLVLSNFTSLDVLAEISVKPFWLYQTSSGVTHDAKKSVRPASCAKKHLHLSVPLHHEPATPTIKHQNRFTNKGKLPHPVSLRAIGSVQLRVSMDGYDEKSMAT